MCMQAACNQSVSVCIYVRGGYRGGGGGGGGGLGVAILPFVKIPYFCTQF